jgi:hypothetical protein
MRRNNNLASWGTHNYLYQSKGSVVIIMICLEYEVIFLNGVFMTHGEMLRDIEKFRPKFIGIYTTTFGWNKAKKTADELKRVYARDVFICACS